MVRRVDVLMVVSGPAPWLEQALLSLAWQDERELRLVLVADGLPKADRALVERWQVQREVRWTPAPPPGEGTALGAGLALCTAPFVALLQPADVCHPRRLSLQAAALSRHADATTCHCAARVMDEDGLLAAGLLRPPLGGVTPATRDGDALPPWSSSLMVRRAALREPDLHAGGLLGEALRAPRTSVAETLVTVRWPPGSARPVRAVAGSFGLRLTRTPSVAVVIPARNMEAWLGATLDSVAAQTLVPHEVIVVDDGSTDGTRDLAASHPVVTRVVDGPVRGLAAARNAGITASSAEVVVPCDADDLLEPDWLARAAGILGRRPAVGLVAGRNVSIDEDGTRLLPDPPPPGPWDAARLAERNTMAAPSGTALRRTALDAVGGFDERLRFAEDWDLWQRLASSCAAVTCDSPAARIRLRRASMVRSGNAEATLEPRLARLGAHAPLQARALVHLDVARVLLAQGAPARAAAQVQQALALDGTPGVRRQALSLLAGAAVPPPVFRALFEARRRLRRAGGRLLDEVLPSPRGRRR